MDIHNRCPECGQRLKTNYCDICMRKVPFGGVRQAKYRDPWENKDGSSAHRMERGHECVSFGEEKKKTLRKPAAKRASGSPKKILQKIAVFIAVFSLVPSLLGLLEGITGAESVPAPEPADSIYDGFVPAGDPGAEDIPKVASGEIYNENGIRVTVDDAGLNHGDYAIFLTIHNESDHKISVNADQVSVNGYMFPFGFYHDVKAGRSQQTFLTFYAHELEKAGIKQVGQVEFILDIYDEHTYENTQKLVAVETDYAGDLSTDTAIQGMQLYADENLTVLLQDTQLYEYGDYELNLYMQNHSQHTVNVFNGAVWVNGEEVSGYLWQMLRPNTCAVNSIYIYELDAQEDLNIQSLDEIKEITIELYVEFMDGWEIVDTVSEVITFEPCAIQ